MHADGLAAPAIEALPPAIPAPDAPAAIQPAVAAWRKPFLALDEPSFRRLWLCTLPGVLAMQMDAVTTGYVAYNISGAAAAIGLVSIGATTPMLVFGLFGGVVADRFPKRRVLQITQGTIGVAALINAALVLSGIIQIWQLVLVAMLQGSAFAFNMPSRQAFIAQLVSRERLTNAIGLHSASSNLARVIGPGLAGGLIALPFLGPGHVFLLEAAMYGVVVLGLLRVPQRGEPVGTHRPSPLRSIGDGLGFIRGSVTVRTLLLLAIVPMFLAMPYQQLMPVFAEDIFHVGAAGLGMLLTINGIGALAGSLTVASLTTFRRRGMLQIVLGMALGLAVAVFAFAQSFEVALVVLLVMGAVSGGFQALNGALIISNSDVAYTGRVMSVYMLTFSATDIGTVCFGTIADRIGAPLAVGIGGLLVTAIIGVVGLLNRSLREMR